jgi:hypothetical protein
MGAKQWRFAGQTNSHSRGITKHSARITQNTATTNDIITTSARCQGMEGVDGILGIAKEDGLQGIADGGIQGNEERSIRTRA